MKLDASHKKRILRVSVLLFLTFVVWRAFQVVPREVAFEVHSESWEKYQMLSLDIFHEGVRYKQKQWALARRTPPSFFVLKGPGMNRIQISMNPGVYQVWVRAREEKHSREVEITVHVPEQSVVSVSLPPSLEDSL